jgi:hypothetical protein
MTLLRWLTWIVAIVLALSAAIAKVGAAANALHRSLHLADLHADTLLWGRDILKRGTRGHVDVPRLIEGRFATIRFFMERLPQ